MANKIDLADAQFTGFHHGSKGYSLMDLIKSMGLTKSEWQKWKRDYNNHVFYEYEITEIDNFFNKLKPKQ